jgi:hypothetical protein
MPKSRPWTVAAAEALWRLDPRLDFRFMVFDGELANSAKELGVSLYPVT